MKSNPSEIHLIASMLAIPGREEELREVLRFLFEPTRKEPGCRRYDMYASDQTRRFFANASDDADFTTGTSLKVDGGGLA